VDVPDPSVKIEKNVRRFFFRTQCIQAEAGSAFSGKRFEPIGKHFD